MSTALKIGALVRFYHDRHGGPVHRVVSVTDDGMIDIDDMGGYFAPHLFVVADDVGDIPPIQDAQEHRAAVARRMYEACNPRAKGMIEDALNYFVRSAYAAADIAIAMCEEMRANAKGVAEESRGKMPFGVNRDYRDGSQDASQEIVEAIAALPLPWEEG